MNTLKPFGLAICLSVLFVVACGQAPQSDQIACSDHCLAGQTRCQGAGVQSCRDVNGDGCLQWGDWVACPGTQICVGGVCQLPDQTGECLQPGQRRCLGNGYQVCGDPDDDGVLDWSEAVPCLSGYNCQNGECMEIPETVCTNDSLEPNDDLQRASAIDPGEFRGLVICERDQDWFSIALGAGDSLEARVVLENASSAVELSLLDSAGLRLAAGELNGNTLMMLTQVGSQGVYYLVVAGRGELTSAYRLNVLRREAEDECIDDRFEDNDSMHTATEVVAGTGTDLRICGNDEDWYAIDLRGGDILRVEIQFAHRRGDLNLWLYDGQENLVGNSSSNSDSEVLMATAQGAGRYRILVRGNGVDETSYSLLLEITQHETCQADVFEPNDSWQAAADLGIGQVQNLTLCGADQDWFSIDLNAGETFKADFFFSHQEGDLDVVVFDPFSNRVASGESHTDNESLTVYASEAGQYTLQVVGPQDASIHYGLHLAVDASDVCIDDGYESNDSFLTAYPLDLFTQVQNRFTNLMLCEGDKDWFKIYMYAGETLMLDIRFLHSRGDLDLYLLSDYLEVLGWSTSYSDNESIQLTIPWEGIYYIRVTGFGDSNSYDLSVGIY